MNYKLKYYKYNQKILNFQAQIGGYPVAVPCNDFISLGNRLGTCWNIVIQIIMMFGDTTSEVVQNKLTDFTPTEIVENAIELLQNMLPFYLLDENELLTTSTKNKIISLVEIVKERFNIKIDDNIDLLTINTGIESEPEYMSIRKLRRSNSITCEKNFTDIFFSLFNEDKSLEKEDGGSPQDSFFMVNLFGALFCNKLIDHIYVNFGSEINMELVESPLLIGITAHISGHVTCFYKCNEELKFCNNSEINDFNWTWLFEFMNAQDKKNIKYDLLIGHEVPYIYIPINSDGNTEVIKFSKKDLVRYTDDAKNNVTKFIFLNYLDDRLMYNFREKFIYYYLDKLDLNIEKNYLKILQHLNDIDNYSDSIFMLLIIKKYNVDILKKYLLTKTINLDYQNKNGCTSLAYAIIFGNSDVALEILKYEQNLNIKTHLGLTFLEFAIFYKKELIEFKIIELLSKNNLLLNSAIDDYISREINGIVLKILDHGQNLNWQNDNGFTILMIAINKKKLDLVTKILERLPNLNIINNNGYTALMLAIKLNYFTIVQKILKYEQNLNIKNNAGNTSLMIAIIYQNTEIAQEILKYFSPDINIKNNKGNTALMLAIIFKDAPVVLTILKNKSLDLSIKNKKGQTAFDLANEYRDVDIIKKIKSLMI